MQILKHSQLLIQFLRRLRDPPAPTTKSVHSEQGVQNAVRKSSRDFLMHKLKGKEGAVPLLLKETQNPPETSTSLGFITSKKLKHAPI